MNLPEDMKSWRAPRFFPIPPDAALIAIFCLLLLALILDRLEVWK